MKRKKGKTNLSIFHVLITVLISSISCLLLLAPHLSLPDVLNQLLVLLRNKLLNFINSEFSNEPFKNVSNLDLEVIRVFVGPSEQGWNQSGERWLDKGC